ncbi:hypothetical protein AMR72_17715 [Flavobacterium psychrophilum]|nr:hypothetical protein AMR72_17715 [Flavobacterium psychrophilum]AOE54178.1 hypothetical protein ALW18_17700 [Flavobacterium psychrophilum]
MINENFKPVKQAFEKAGVDVKKAEFSITEYSLNTDLSFKFENLGELLRFLEVSAHSEKFKAINAMLVDSGIDPNNFFYVNFYKQKVAEL